MKEKIQKFRDYLDYIEEHYNNVQKSWKLIQEKCKNKGFKFIYDDFVFSMLDAEIKQHDFSKLSTEEFTQYRQYFFPCEEEVENKKLFNIGWEHHKSVNDHHWQNWTHENKLYPEIQVVHNLVDWMAMSLKFGGTVMEYYENNKDEINIPEWAEKLMYEIMNYIYGTRN